MYPQVRFQMEGAPAPATAPATATAPRRVVEAVGVQVDSDEGQWTRLSANGGSASGRDLTPMSQDFMQRSAEFLWQSNVLANRLVEVPMAFLLAEGVRLTCKKEEHQKLLDRFWQDPINAWPLKLPPRVRDLALMGEQCYATFVNEHDGFVRLGYVDPRTIGEVILDPDNPEQPIGVITKRDNKGRYRKYRVAVLGPDEELFTKRTQDIRASFSDGQVFLFQANKLATGTRGRSDLLHLIDWIDAYDGFLFGELDRSSYMRAFTWDLEVKGATEDKVKERAGTFKAPLPNSTFVHNENEVLTPKAAGLEADDSSIAARLFRNHILAGATLPEHWIGGGGDVNRAAASEMGEPTFKVLTARQTFLKQMLEELGRFVLASQKGAAPDWASDDWKVVAEFPELVSRDVTKFAAALQSVAAAVVVLLDKGLVTEETGLQLVADVAMRFGQAIDAKAELEKAREQAAERRSKADAADAFGDPQAGENGGDNEPPAKQPGGSNPAATANGNAQP